MSAAAAAIFSAIVIAETLTMQDQDRMADNGDRIISQATEIHPYERTKSPIVSPWALGRFKFRSLP